MSISSYAGPSLMNNHYDLLPIVTLLKWLVGHMHVSFAEHLLPADAWMDYLRK